jgi:AsmA-like C-terminal region
MRFSSESSESTKSQISESSGSSQPPSTKLFVSWRAWLILLPFSVAITIIVLFALHWPYSERNLLPVLQDTFKSNITAQKFRRFYFPRPGCEADYVTFRRLNGNSKEPPLAEIQKLTITGGYFDLIFRTHHIAAIRINGLYIRVPASSGEHSSPPELSSDLTPTKISVGSLSADGAQLEFETEDRTAPLKFEIHELEISPIAKGEALGYQVRMAIPEPPGELESQGTFGPLQAGPIGRLALRGNVRLIGAKLDKYPGIAGTLASTDKFNGTLEQVQVIGEASVPNFHLKSAAHPVPVTSQFRVLVNGLAGEVTLQNVVGKIGQTGLRVDGQVSKNLKLGRRETDLDFSIAQGRAEDLLWLFSHAKKPAMTGIAICSGRARVSKYGDGFLSSLTVNGRFEVRDGHFQPETQIKLNELSARAQGKKIENASGADEVAVTSLSSEVKIQEAVAHLGRVYFEAPGARARVQGSYDLESHKVDLHGDLWTDASLSQDTTGLKALLLKPMDPLFKRRRAGAMVEVTMEGNIYDPHFGAALTKTNTAWRGKP